MRTFAVIDVPQRSPAWHQARLGRLTGSRAADILGSIKKGESAARRHLRVQLALERVTGVSHKDGYVSLAMQQGIDREVDASALYEALTGRVLSSTGFLSHETLMAGCSLDGHIGDFEGIVEIKSPLPATHLEYLKTGNVPIAYLQQIRHALWITGAQWCDWLSYNPDFPDALSAKLVRVPRVDADIVSYELLARQFLAEVDQDVQAILALQ